MLVNIGNKNSLFCGCGNVIKSIHQVFKPVFCVIFSNNCINVILNHGSILVKLMEGGEMLVTEDNLVSYI